MINFHSHTFFSDGELSPAELICRCARQGYRAIGLSDHADESNFENIIISELKCINEINKENFIKVVCGIELTYVLPKNIAKVAAECRKAGAKIVIVHGETLSEDVYPETDLYATQCRDVDILAHPGLISEKAVKYAAKNNILLEITSRRGHCLSNGYVARLSAIAGAKNILSTDTHSPDDIISLEFGKLVLSGAGMSNKEITATLKNAENLLKRRM